MQGVVGVVEFFVALHDPFFSSSAISRTVTSTPHAACPRSTLESALERMHQTFCK